MDPNTVSRDLRDALKARDWETVITCSATLRCWVQMGGFPPEGMSARGALFLAQTLYEFALDHLGAQYLAQLEAADMEWSYS